MPQSDEERIVGTWELLRFEHRKPDGSIHYPQGKGAVGRLVYEASGRMIGQIMGDAKLAFSHETPARCKPDERRAAYDNFIAYFGTWRLDQARGCLVHRVEGAYFPPWVGGEQIRLYGFNADGSLTLRIPPKAEDDGSQFAVIWKRAGS